MKIYLPWYGEFGFYVAVHTRRVFVDTDKVKIICCPESHKCLFPTASGFYHDYKVYGSRTVKFAKSREVYLEKEALKVKLHKTYGICNVIESDMSVSMIKKISRNTLRNINFIPHITKKHNLYSDIVIVPRKKDDIKNFNRWQEIADRLKADGLTVSAIGVKDQSYDIKGTLYNSWDYEDVESDIELIMNSKVVISTDTAGAHLATLCQKPLVVFYNPEQKWQFMWMFELWNRQTINLGSGVWNNPELITNVAINKIEGE